MKSKTKGLNDIITPDLAFIYLRDPVRFVREVIFNVNWKGYGGKYEVTEQQEQMLNALAKGDKNLSVRAGRGIGKALSDNNLLPMPDGSSKRIGDIVEGDYVLGSNGKPVEVVGVFPQGERQLYTITMSNGCTVDCDIDHLWSVKKRSDREDIVMSTGDLIEYLKNSKRSSPTIQYCNPVEYSKKNLSIDPYVLGALLGDGCLNKKVRFTNPEKDIVENIKSKGYKVTGGSDGLHYSVGVDHKKLDDLGLLHKRSHEKFIPNIYKSSNVEDRINILRGLFDTDGCVVSGNFIEFSTTSEQLSADTAYIVRSLGGSAVGSCRESCEVVKNGVTRRCRKIYRLHVKFPNGIMPISSEKHISKYKRCFRNKRVSIKKIEKANIEKATCISVDSPDSLFLCENFIVTHNTAFLSFVILWWMCTRPDAQLLVTAPSFPQLQGALWKQVRDWLQRSVVRHCFVHTRTRMYNKDNESSVAEPRTASKLESVQGVHNEYLLIIADEASGIEDPIMETIYGSLTEEKNRMLMMFNPTRVSGFAYDSHNANKALWKTFAFSSEHSPLVDHKWLSAMKQKHLCGDVPDDVYRVHVLGEFPSGDPEALLSFDEVYAARDRFGVKMEGEVEIGVDLAEMGDDSTVVCPRWGNYALSAKDIGFGKEDILCSWGQTKAPETVKNILRIVDLVRAYTGYTGRIPVKLDNGGLGSPIISFLEEHERDYNIKVIRVNFGGSGKNYEEDDNEATRMWFHLKSIIDHVKIPYDQFMLEELVSRKWMLAENGKRKIEPKRRFKARFGNSPDRADAVILAFAPADNHRNIIANYTDTANRVEVRSEAIARIGNRFRGTYMNSTGILSVVSVSFSNGMLGIYDCCEAPIDAALASGIFQDRCKWTVGSSNMFTGGNDVALKMMMSGVSVIESFMYNESGAILGLDILAKKEGIVVGDTCSEFANQLNTWTVNHSKSDLKETHGMCYALLQIVSMLMMQYKQEFGVGVDKTLSRYRRG